MSDGDGFRTPGSLSALNAFDADADSKRTVGAVSTVIGGAALVTGVILLIVDWTRRPEPGSAVGIEPVLGLNDAGLSGRF